MWYSCVEKILISDSHDDCLKIWGHVQEYGFLDKFHIVHVCGYEGVNFEFNCMGVGLGIGLHVG